LVRKDVSDPDKGIGHTRTRNITNFLQERLPKKLFDNLTRAGRIADQLGFESYVVGGFVRDLFLFRANEDIDLVIEGDGIVFAKALAAKSGARVHSHTKFGTAVIIFKDDFKIDVASARLEYYKYPAALPDVEMSSIKLDLFRRDFTVNTLAIHLNPAKFGRLIDFFSAQKDIKDRAIRVLHNLSFVEDPTRVFRAIRFEQRFGFSIGKLTSSLIDNAVKMDFFKRLSGRRVFAEIKQILQEENPAAAIARMQDYDLLKVIHPSIVLDKGLKDRLNGAKSVIAWHDLLFTEEPYARWLIYFMVLIHPCDLETSIAICKKLELPQQTLRILCHERLNAQQRVGNMEQRLPQTARDLYHLLDEFEHELILYMMTITRQKDVKKAISTYYNQLRNISPIITGNDLKTLGPGLIP
ncbi:MAG: polya polymerase, partial [Desulfosarcinaceae bacterium]